MKPPVMPKWESVDRNTERMRVATGWLYRTIQRDYCGQVISLSAPAFVPLRKKEPKGKREVVR